MRPDISLVHRLLAQASGRYPGVQWRHARAADAARAVLGRRIDEPLVLNCNLIHGGDFARLEVEANHDSFGPQPFLAIRTHDKRYLSDNMEIHRPRRLWSYTFDADTVPLDAVHSFGVASSDDNGSTNVVVMRPDGRQVASRCLS
jgi:hypothetical protein